MERLFRMHKLTYICAGGLLILNSVPQVFPSLPRKSCELSNTPPPEGFVRHVKKIAKAMKLPHHDNIDVFIANSFSSLSLGSTSLPNGAVIGLSRVLLFRTEEDVKNANVSVGTEPVDWSSPEGHALLHLLLPSADVINFRIAHEVAHLKRHDIWWNAVLSPVFLVGGYHIAVLVCKRWFMGSVAFAFPAVMVITLLAYTQCSALLDKWLEYRADRAAAMCSKAYAEGGVQVLRSYLQMEQLTSRISKSWIHKIVDHFASHPGYEQRLDRLERLLLLYR